MYPDIAEVIKKITKNEESEEKSEPLKSFIIDSEIVAYDPKLDKILPFQILTQRSKKNVVIDKDSIQVCIFAFDILFLNGKSLLNKTYRDRRGKL